MTKRAVLLLLVLSAITWCGEQVYVIHGYGSSTALTAKIATFLTDSGFATVNFKYRSMRDDLDSIGRHLYGDIKAARIDTVLFVTHSMGALVVRSILNYSTKDSLFPAIPRIVMIAPPNHGAEIADFFSSPLLKTLLGPNVQHMRTDSGSYANRLPLPLHSEVGVIIGQRTDSGGYNPFIKGANDGFLAVDRAKLGIEKDIAIVKGEHSMLLFSTEVRTLVLRFLKQGTFTK
jgi:triacylglycerol lipase